jgi:general secretion pathway protein H
LVEILVVVVIIAVLTAVAVFSVGILGHDRELETEGQRLADVMAAASEQAQLEGKDFGLWVGMTGYQVLRYSPGVQTWEAVPGDRLYQSHTLPTGLLEVLEVEGKVLVLDPPKSDKPRRPQVIIYASGDVSPYRWQLGRTGDEAYWRIDGLPDGTMKVRKPGDTDATR